MVKLSNKSEVTSTFKGCLYEVSWSMLVKNCLRTTGQEYEPHSLYTAVYKLMYINVKCVFPPSPLG